MSFDIQRFAFTALAFIFAFPFGYFLMEGTFPSAEFALRSAIFALLGAATIVLIRSRGG